MRDLFTFSSDLHSRICSGYNIGYKQADPLNSCQKCWQKYGKPFTGALTYASFSENGGGDGTLQRPLPRFNGPQQRQPQHPPMNGGHIQSPPLPPRPPLQQQYTSQPIIRETYFPPQNSNAIVLQAGDPRLGGNLCWNCGGGGRISLFFGLDDETCKVCRGVGRVF